MAYENFKPTVWSKYIQHELECKNVLVKNCNRKYEGEAKRGREVKIIGVAPPTIGNYTGADIGTPETLPDSATVLKIDQAKYFHFQVDDVDKAQALPGMMEAYMTEATRAMAIVRDRYVAAQAVDAGGFSASAAITTAAAAKAAVDDGIEWLRTNDVNVDDEVVIELAPFLYRLLRDQLIELKTDNNSLIAKGSVGMYDNCKVFLTNNLYNDGTDDYMMLRSTRAVAWADGIEDLEAYRPERHFSDAVKGLYCFGAKVVRSKEFYVIKGRAK